MRGILISCAVVVISAFALGFMSGYLTGRGDKVIPETDYITRCMDAGRIESDCIVLWQYKYLWEDEGND